MSLLHERVALTREESSLWRRLAWATLAPRRSFDAVQGREAAHDWLFPALLATAVGLVAHFATVGLVTDLNAPGAQRAMAAMDPARREQFVQGIEALRAHGWMMVPTGVFSSLVVVAAALLVVTRWLGGSQVSFRQMLVVKAYASLTLIPEWAVRTPAMLLTGDANVRTGPALFLAPEQAGGLLGRVVAGMNVFDIWQLWIQVVGVAVLGGTSLRKAGVVLTALWLAWIVGGAALEGYGVAALPSPAAG